MALHGEAGDDFREAPDPAPRARTHMMSRVQELEVPRRSCRSQQALSLHVQVRRNQGQTAAARCCGANKSADGHKFYRNAAKFGGLFFRWIRSNIAHQPGPTRERKPAMRKLIAMALIGASAALFSATAPAQAMTAGSAGVAKAATTVDSPVEQVRRRWHRHRHYHRHRHWRHRHHHRRWYRPYYYGGYAPYYGYRYYRRPRVGIYFNF